MDFTGEQRENRNSLAGSALRMNSKLASSLKKMEGLTTVKLCVHSGYHAFSTHQHDVA